MANAPGRYDRGTVLSFVVKQLSIPLISTSTKYLVSSLIHVSGRVVEYSQHREQAVRDAVRAGDVRAGRADAVHREADATCVLRDERTLLQRVVDPWQQHKHKCRLLQIA